jgi:hypothetical protein
MSNLHDLAEGKRKEAEKQIVALEAWMDSQQIPILDRPLMLAMASGKAIRDGRIGPRDLAIALCKSILETYA